VLAYLDELSPVFEIGLQPAERYFRHSELKPKAIEEEPVVDGVKGRRQVEADQDSNLLVVGVSVNRTASCKKSVNKSVIMLEKLRGALQMKMTATCGIQKFR